MTVNSILFSLEVQQLHILKLLNQVLLKLCVYYRVRMKCDLCNVHTVQYCFNKCECISCEVILQSTFLSLGWSDLSLLSIYTVLAARIGTSEITTSTVDYGKNFLIGRLVFWLALAAIFIPFTSWFCLQELLESSFS